MITREDLEMVVVLAEAGKAILAAGDSGAVARVRAELDGAAEIRAVATVVWCKATDPK